MRLIKFFLFSTVFATPLQKLTAENAARSASFLLASRAMPLPWCSGGTLPHTVCAIQCHFITPHSVCHIVPPPNAALGRQNEEVIKVFLYFLRQCCAAVLTMAENAARSASFLLNIKGLPLPWCSGGTLPHTVCAIQCHFITLPHTVCAIQCHFITLSLTQWHDEAVGVFTYFSCSVDNGVPRNSRSILIYSAAGTSYAPKD